MVYFGTIGLVSIVLGILMFLISPAIQEKMQGIK